MNAELSTLLDMLTYCRPAGSQTDREFCARFIPPSALRDLYGNYHVYIDNLDGSPSGILWSCHTDTVHRSDGRQTVRYSPATGLVKLSKRSYRDKRNCLGADDTVGVWLCLQMIARGIPGHYTFHYGEERGGIGSGNLVAEDPTWFADARYVIALDRRGTQDVITNQAGDRSASDLFAYSLALELDQVGLDYRPSDRGIYTDSAEYMYHVPECTNLSVGYYAEHTIHEYLDTDHALRLLEGLCLVREDHLRSARLCEIPSWRACEVIDRYSTDYTDPGLVRGNTLSDKLDRISHEEDTQSFYLDRIYDDIAAAIVRENNKLKGEY